MDADGGNQTSLTNNPGSYFQPAWSPDGDKIAFTSNRDGNPEVYVMDADGANPTSLTNNPGSTTEPAWSPDGSQDRLHLYRGENTSLRDGRRRRQPDQAHQQPRRATLPGLVARRHEDRLHLRAATA